MATPDLTGIDAPSEIPGGGGDWFAQQAQTFTPQEQAVYTPPEAGGFTGGTDPNAATMQNMGSYTGSTVLPTGQQVAPGLGTNSTPWWATPYQGQAPSAPTASTYTPQTFSAGNYGSAQPFQNQSQVPTVTPYNTAAFQSQAGTPGQFNPTAYSLQQIAGPGQTQTFNPATGQAQAFNGQASTQTFNPTTQPVQNFTSPVSQVGQFSAAPSYDPGTYQAPAGFTAPTDVTMQNDPGYQFRLQQAQQAMENSASAKGNLMTGGFVKGLNDYAQNYASGEYQNVYNRALQDYNTNVQNNLTAYQTNAQTGLAANAQAYGQAANTFGLNTSAQNQNYQQALAASQQNAAIQSQNYGQEQNTASTQAALQNQAYQQQLAASQQNAAVQAQNYGQASNTFGVNQAAQAQNFGQMATAATTNAALQQQQYGQQQTTAATQAALQNQAYQQQLAQWQANQQAGYQEHQANTTNALNAQQQQYAQNLGGYQASNTAQLGFANVNASAQNAANQLNASQGLQGAQLNQTANQNAYQNAFNAYLQNYNQYNQGQQTAFNNAYSLAQLGNPGAPNYGQNASQNAELTTGAGNAKAAGTVGAANAWNSAFGNIANSANMYGLMNQPNTTNPYTTQGQTYNTNIGPVKTNP